MLGVHYGYRPWEIGRLTLPQIEAYIHRLAGALEIQAHIAGGAQAAVLGQMFGR